MTLKTHNSVRQHFVTNHIVTHVLYTEQNRTELNYLKSEHRHMRVWNIYKISNNDMWCVQKSIIKR
jgi:hypothetical protein